jgi:hypothetical protein
MQMNEGIFGKTAFKVKKLTPAITILCARKALPAQPLCFGWVPSGSGKSNWVDDVAGLLLATLVEHGGSQLGEVVQTQIPGAGNPPFLYAGDRGGIATTP